MVTAKRHNAAARPTRSISRSPAAADVVVQRDDFKAIIQPALKVALPRSRSAGRGLHQFHAGRVRGLRQALPGQHRLAAVRRRAPSSTPRSIWWRPRNPSPPASQRSASGSPARWSSPKSPFTSMCAPARPRRSAICCRASAAARPTTPLRRSPRRPCRIRRRRARRRALRWAPSANSKDSPRASRSSAPNRARSTSAPDSPASRSSRCGSAGVVQRVYIAGGVMSPGSQAANRERPPTGEHLRRLPLRALLRPQSGRLRPLRPARLGPRRPLGAMSAP